MNAIPGKTIPQQMPENGASDEAIGLLRQAEECDRQGRENEAVAYYERALALGLPGDVLAGAILGLGSTLRSLGRYDAAERVLHEGMTRFPDERSFTPFFAMTLYNLQRPKEAVALLLRVLLDTTDSSAIREYERAIRAYAADLDATSA